MALYHFSVKIISKSTSNVCAASAYRAGTSMTSSYSTTITRRIEISEDKLTGEIKSKPIVDYRFDDTQPQTYNYKKRAHSVNHRGVFLPSGV